MLVKRRHSGAGFAASDAEVDDMSGLRRMGVRASIA